MQRLVIFTFHDGDAIAKERVGRMNYLLLIRSKDDKYIYTKYIFKYII